MDHIAHTGDPFLLGLAGLAMVVPKGLSKIGTLAGAHPGLAAGGAANGAYGAHQFLRTNFRHLHDKAQQHVRREFQKRWPPNFNQAPVNGEWV